MAQPFDRFHYLKQITNARHNEMMRVADLIEAAIVQTPDEDVKTLDALVALAAKVLRP